MNRSDVTNLLHENAGNTVKNTIETQPEVRIVSRVGEAIKLRRLTQNKVATISGLRPTTISEMVNGTRSALTKSHVVAIMIALRITDVREIFDIEFPPETVAQFDKERREWINNDVIPEAITALYTKNAVTYLKNDIRG